MRIFFDTEFTGLHQRTSLISIGLVSEDNKKFYAEFSDYDKTQVNSWIQENVVDKLWINGDINEYSIPEWYYYASKEHIREKLAEYFAQFDEVELVSDCCHYDMTLLVDIFGTAFDLPKNVCPACYDINQDIGIYHKISAADAFDVCREDFVSNALGIVTPEDQKHTAIHDAEIIKKIYEIINGKV